MFSIIRQKSTLNDGRPSMVITDNHFIYNKPIKGPFPEGTKKVMVGMGCFWGVERIFWEIPGIVMTAAGYSGGSLENPTYQDVCSLKTGHNEVVLIHYNPSIVSFKFILKTFWEGHDPTQGMRQGNDIGSQYRSGIYTYSASDLDFARKTKLSYRRGLQSAGFGEITTEILTAKTFYFAEQYHQQYLGKNPNGYCGIGGTGVCF